MIRCGFPAALIAPVASALVFAMACSPTSPETTSGEASPTEADRQASIPAEMTIDTPQPGAEVASPIQLSGTVPGTWYFEGSFPLELVGPDGKIIAEHYASSQDNWMTEAPVDFQAEIAFSVDRKTPATLVLREDDPSGQQEVREAKLPLILLPTP